MEELPPEALIAAYIESMSARSASDAQRLCTAILQRCWPGGGTDRSDPCAVEWVLRWSPRRVLPPTPECTCVQGRCTICN
jgi:hypothetical protein